MRLKNAVDARISYASGFLEWEAATAAGLDMWKWEHGDYPRWFRARVIAWFNLHGLVGAHQEDAAAQAIEQKAKKKGRS